MKYLTTLFASRRSAVLPAVAGLLLASQVLAHHSFAVFFDDSKTVSVTGTVADFRFLNPHGVIRLDVVDKAGTKQVWKAETNSPSILERRGWTKDSIKAGEVLTIEGWPARDGANYMRLRGAKHADGTPVGVLQKETAGEQK
ncbi:MAG: DUF6152 family protein [Pseudomonadota bacterium]